MANNKGFSESIYSLERDLPIDDEILCLSQHYSNSGVSRFPNLVFLGKQHISVPYT